MTPTDKRERNNMNKKDIKFLDSLHGDILIAAGEAHSITEGVHVNEIHANNMMDILEKLTNYIKAN